MSRYNEFSFIIGTQHCTVSGRVNSSWVYACCTYILHRLRSVIFWPLFRVWMTFTKHLESNCTLTPKHSFRETNLIFMCIKYTFSYPTLHMHFYWIHCLGSLLYVGLFYMQYIVHILRKFQLHSNALEVCTIFIST